MKFNQVKLAVKMIMMAGRVAMLQGERGIGKSTMAKEIAKELGLQYINIDCNLLKEGEIGGLPISENRIKETPYLVDGVQQKDEQGNLLIVEEVVGKKTSYAPYSKLLQALELCEKGQPVLLFLDELNRAESAVIQECMNLILNREINGLQLPSNCYLLGAMNPPGGNENGEVNYQVTEMDSAAVDRFIWINLESNLNDWLDWAVSSVNVKGVENRTDDEIVINTAPRTQNIHNDIIEFLSQPQNKDLLNVTPTELKPITASPRSWEMLSDVLFVYEANKDKVPEEIFINIAKGCVGDETAIEFIRFTKDNSNPLITPKEFFKLKLEDLENVVSNEAPIRQFILFKNVLNYLIDTKGIKKDHYKRLIDALGFVPVDMMVSIMKTIKNNYGKVFNVCTENEEFLDLFMNMYNYMN